MATFAKGMAMPHVAAAGLCLVALWILYARGRKLALE